MKCIILYYYILLYYSVLLKSYALPSTILYIVRDCDRRYICILRPGSAILMKHSAKVLELYTDPTLVI